MVRLLVAVLLVPLFSFIASAEDLPTMLTFVPKDANAIMAVNIKGVLAAPMAEKEGWKKKVTEETMIGVLPFPETAEHAVVAQLLMPGTLQGKWELVLISTNKPYSFADIAKAEKAEVETIGKTSVCFTRRNMVLVQLSPTLLGAFSPAHRQDVARWLKAQTGKLVITPTLARVTESIKAGNEVSIIFDVEDTLEAGKVKQYLATQKEVQEKKLDVAALSKVFSSLDAVTINIDMDQTIKATLKAEFDQTLGNFGSVLPNLIINALDGIGADLEEYRKGTIKQSEKSFEIQLNLTGPGLKSTLAMMQPHSITPQMAKDVANAKDDPAKEAQKVFRAIQTLANTAHEQAERSENIGRAMVIYDNAATRLDKMAISHVDEELQFFAADVARGLREMATVLHGGVLEVQTLESKIRTNVTVDYVRSNAPFANPWGFSFWNPMLPPQPQLNVQSNQAEVIAAQQEAILRAVRKRNEIWRALIEKSTAAKKSLATKYGVAF
ncbi:MAG: hypothetical protein QM703_09655 [Gemmatales bacterium]